MPVRALPPPAVTLGKSPQTGKGVPTRADSGDHRRRARGRRLVLGHQRAGGRGRRARRREVRRQAHVRGGGRQAAGGGRHRGGAEAARVADARRLRAGAAAARRPGARDRLGGRRDRAAAGRGRHQDRVPGLLRGGAHRGERERSRGDEGCAHADGRRLLRERAAERRDGAGGAQHAAGARGGARGAALLRPRDRHQEQHLRAHLQALARPLPGRAPAGRILGARACSAC